jgi:hypothetical protein
MPEEISNFVMNGRTSVCNFETMNSITNKIHTYMRHFAVLAALLLMHLQTLVSQTIQVNELMSSNQTVLADEDGDFSDWIELYNPGDTPVNLQGWGLSDKGALPFQWTFPAVTLQPDSYLLVWASGKNRRPDLDSYTSGIRLDMFQNIPGSNVDALLYHPDYPMNPAYTSYLTDLFETPSNIDDNYGQRLVGLIRAPVTGNYHFQISGDDNSRLLLSTDESPENLRIIATVPEWTNIREWDKYPQQKSEAIGLVAGQYYYIMALMKEGAGGDNLAVGWVLPDGSTEAPLSASHVFIPHSQLHTTFALSAKGDSLLLTRPDGVQIQAMATPAMPEDFSYGLKPGTSEFLFFNEPTPDAENGANGYAEIISDVPQFSHTGGFFTNGFDLTLSGTDPACSIIYTLDGSEPDVANLGGSSYQYKNSYPAGPYLTREMNTLTYSDPLPITDRSPEPYQIATINVQFTATPRLPRSNFFKGTVVRAKFVKEGALVENSATHTYFVTPLGYQRYTLPVVSLAANENDLYDYVTGIYVAGEIATDWYYANPGSSFNGGSPANYNQRDREWERPGHFEYFSVDDHTRFSQDVGIRVHGAWSRANYFKSLRLYARTSTGDGIWFDHPFFGDLPRKGGKNG